MRRTDSETRAQDAEDRSTDGALLSRRAPRISQDEVFRAADELLLEGHRPTIDRVRMRLGRGSPNTINDHLDLWWSKLGARLRDIPNREFPQLPERVAKSLLLLWNEALDGARSSLSEALGEREQQLQTREQAAEAQARRLTEQEQAFAVRTNALEEALTLAREQLTAANRRAETLERTAQARETEYTAGRDRLAAAETALTRAQTAFDQERARLNQRYDAAEARWLGEVDRARQAGKEQAQQLKQTIAENRNRRTERDRLRRELASAEAELKAAAVIREQLEKRLRPARGAKGKGIRKPKR